MNVDKGIDHRAQPVVGGDGIACGRGGAERFPEDFVRVVDVLQGQHMQDRFLVGKAFIQRSD